MDDFALDPALFGVAGPSTSAAGRVRDIPDKTQLPGASQAVLQAVHSRKNSGLAASSSSSNASGSGSESSDDSDEDSEADDEEDDEDEDEEEADGTGLADDSHSQTVPQPARLPPLPPSRSVAAAYKGKGRAMDSDVVDGYATGSGDVDENGDLSRLISAIRDNNDSTNTRGVLGTEWDRTMQQELEEMELEEAQTPRHGKKKPPKPSRGRVALADQEPSREVKLMLGDANYAYVLGDHKKATSIYTEIIRIEPSTKKAWLGLAGIHAELGNKDKEIQALIVATQLSKSYSEDWKSLAVQSEELGLTEQAIYCLGQAISRDKSDIEAIWDRARLLVATGKLRQAVAGYNALLKLDAHSPPVLRKLAPLYYELGDLQTGIGLYAASYEDHRTRHRVPRKHRRPDDFGTTDLELYSDLLRSQRRYRDGGKVIADGVRWLQGRIDEEASWESFGDDREYDLKRKTRPGWQERPQKWCEDAPIHQLDTGLRLRLGVCRLFEGRTEDAKIHFGIVMQGDISMIPEYFGEIADAYFDKKMWKEAAAVYLEMTQYDGDGTEENPGTNTPATWIKRAQALRNHGDLDGAIECYEAVVQNEPEDVDSRLTLAEIYERVNDRERALQLVNEVLQQRDRRQETQSDESGSRYAGSDADTAMSGSESADISDGGTRRTKKGRRRKRGKRAPGAPKRTPAALTREERLEEDRRIQQEFDATLLKLQEIDRQMEQTRSDTGELDSSLVYEWLETVAYLIDSYRTTRALFPSDGKKKFTGLFKPLKKKGKASRDIEEEANALATRLQADLQEDEAQPAEADANIEYDSYRGMSFDDWAKLAVRYAFMLTCVDEKDEAEEVLRHMLTSSNMRQDTPRLQFLIFGLAATHIYNDKYDDALDEIRKIITGRRYETEPLRVMQAMCSFGLPALEATVNTKFQKYLLRQIKAIDKKALASTLSDEDNDSDGEEGDTTVPGGSAAFKPGRVNPTFLVLYGHAMASGKSYQSAIVYYLRAYDLRQDDPLICLCLASAYVHRSMQRQSDNRHYHLAQAMAFLDGYRKHCPNDEELHYNFGRIFHQLGVLDLAVKHYEQVLARADERQRDPPMQLQGEQGVLDLSKEAAYNLSLVYYTRNAPELARDVVERYLSL